MAWNTAPVLSTPIIATTAWLPFRLVRLRPGGSCHPECAAAYRLDRILLYRNANNQVVQGIDFAANANLVLLSRTTVCFRISRPDVSYLDKNHLTPVDPATGEACQPRSRYEDTLSSCKQHVPASVFAEAVGAAGRTRSSSAAPQRNCHCLPPPRVGHVSQVDYGVIAVLIAQAVAYGAAAPTAIWRNAARRTSECRPDHPAPDQRQFLIVAGAQPARHQAARNAHGASWPQLRLRVI